MMGKTLGETRALGGGTLGEVPQGLLVYAAHGADVPAAEALAARLGVDLLLEEPPARDDLMLLRADDRGLSLAVGGMELRADLTRMLPRLRPNNLHGEFLVKAAKLKGFVDTPHAVDATAGFGEDSLLLAAAGFEVTMFERNPVTAALVRDALRRAAEEPGLAAAVSRMELVEGDGVEGLAGLAFTPDVVLLDPMFPAREKSASVKKKAQMLQHLEAPCGDEEALLAAALAACPRKVVVKRPPKGPHLAGSKPAYSLAGKNVRYDMYIPAGKAN